MIASYLRLQLHHHLEHAVVQRLVPGQYVLEESFARLHVLRVYHQHEREDGQVDTRDHGTEMRFGGNVA